MSLAGAIVLATSIIVSVSGSTAAAQAVNCNPTGAVPRCFGLQRWESSPPLNGISGTLNASCQILQVPESAGFISEAMWAYFSTSFNTTNTWIEAGLTTGDPANVSPSYRWLYAVDSDPPNHTYQEWYIQPFYLTTDYPIGLYHAANGTWDLYLGGSQIFDYWPTIQTQPQSAYTGLESTHDNTAASQNTNNVAWYDAYGAYGGWIVPTSYSYIWKSNNLVNIAWTTTYSSIVTVQNNVAC
jgi:hypothetical protein